MRQWVYLKLDLNNLTPKATDLDVLCDVGRDGWQLVCINANSVAYLKRETEPVPQAKARAKAAKA